MTTSITDDETIALVYRLAAARALSPIEAIKLAVSNELAADARTIGEADKVHAEMATRVAAT